MTSTPATIPTAPPVPPAAGGSVQETGVPADRVEAGLRSIVRLAEQRDRTMGPPGWLRRDIWARDTTVRDPDGTTPVRRAH